VNLFSFHIPEWIFVAVNLFILIFAMKKLLWGPVSKILDARQAIVAQGLADAELAAEARVNQDHDYEDFLASMERETAEQMKQARIRAGREYDRIVSEAEERSRKIIAGAHAQAEQELASTISAAKTEIITLSLEAAGMLMATNMDSEGNRNLVESFLAEKDVGA